MDRAGLLKGGGDLIGLFEPPPTTPFLWFLFCLLDLFSSLLLMIFLPEEISQAATETLHPCFLRGLLFDVSNVLFFILQKQSSDNAVLFSCQFHFIAHICIPGANG